MWVFIINLGLAHKFSSVLLHNFVAGQHGSTSRSPHLPNSFFSTPVSVRLSPSPPTLYERGKCPSWHFPVDAHMAFCAPGPFPLGTRAHYTNSVAWTHGLLWPTTSVPGVPSAQCAHFTSHAPSRSIVSCTLKKVSCLRSTPTTKRHPFG